MNFASEFLNVACIGYYPQAQYHFRERPTGAAGLSPSHLSVRFKKSTGYSPLQYFTQLKIQRACQYLDHTDMEIKEISAALGFSDPLYFSRVFNKLMKASPKRYRLRKKG